MGGTGDVTLPKFQKFFDQLASSPFTFFRVDNELQLIKFDEVKWSQVEDSASYKFHPEFLHPCYSVLKSNEFSVHVTWFLRARHEHDDRHAGEAKRGSN